MKEISKRFKNETGSNIEISVSEDLEKLDGITIFIKSPDSNSEWVITKKEANILCDLLNKLLA